MDILAILFLIFGWIFKVKGLVITAIVLSGLISFLQLIILAKEKPESKAYSKAKFSFGFDMVLLALSIIKICIW